ncbi:fungal hydrophobin [Epithele typhae]|uniref:fungal hydrophobin n=1 Tax=Epithele typhae TaxID=378194 RepID=UPI002008C3ED|nr:fungal hydrophobin [Epithele typhae]KAH9919983.1 fungal hydrophobin [Epithele typhae]
MMFKTATLITLATFTTLAIATPWNTPTTSATSTVTVTVTETAKGPEPTSSCTIGPIQCCQSTTAATSPAGTALLGLLGIVVEGVDVLLGLNCSPITVIGVGSGSSCSATTVCCENNSQGGLVSIGCVPIIL